MTWCSGYLRWGGGDYIAFGFQIFSFIIILILSRLWISAVLPLNDFIFCRDMSQSYRGRGGDGKRRGLRRGGEGEKEQVFLDEL